MSRRRILILSGLALGLLQTGCVTPGQTGAMSQKPREPATLPAGETAELCLAVADQMISTGHFPEAVHQLNQVRQLNPRADVSPRLARLYARLSKDELALAEYDKALKAHPKDAALWNDLGYFHYERGNWAEAEKGFRKSLEFAPDNQKAWLNLGLALGQSGRYQESLSAFEQSVKPAEARCNLAFVLGTQGKLDEARRLYQEALQLDPNLKLARAALTKLERGPAASAPVVQVSQAPQPQAPQVRTTVPPAQPTTYSPPAPKVFEYPDP
jgi:Tfp pilus assembly protein PilF